jgi:hypothetical protein
MRIKLMPLLRGALQGQTRQTTELVRGILQRIG